jgi:hypothetical protein
MRIRPIVLGFVVLLLDCAALDKLPDDTCGNGVVDASEDCDTFPNDATDPTKPRCGKPTEGELACHLRCGVLANGAASCPEGWGCSTKGICREPTGDFSRALGAVSGGATTLSVGDFDGDGRRDLVGAGPRNSRNSSRVRVHYFDDVGGLVQVSSLPAAVVAPAVFDHDHNGRDDIAFGLPSQNGPGALGVVSGLADRTFLPVVFPAVTLTDTDAVPVPVFEHLPDVKLPNGNDYSIFLFEKDAAGSRILSLDTELGGVARVNRPLPVGPEGLRGRPLNARLFDLDATSACGEVIAAVQVSGAGRLLVLSPCAYVKGLSTTRWDQTPTAFKSFDVPSLSDRTRGLLTAYVDDDTHLDVLVDTDDGPYVLFGDGLSLGPAQKWRPGGITSPKMPLAAADLSLDGKTDYVFPSFLAIQQPAVGGDAGADAGAPTRDGNLTVVTRTLQQKPWSEVAIGHFNGDLLPDVVTAHEGAPDLELYAGGTTGFTFSTVTTDGIVQGLARGDFDGDHVDDVGFTQSSAAGGTSELTIAYGRPTGGLEAPTRIGSVDKSKGLTVLPHGSSPSDLGLYAVTPTAGHAFPSTSLTLLAGSGDRQPLALLFFIDPLSCARATSPCAIQRAPLGPGVARDWSPLSVAAGPIIARDRSAVLTYAAGNLTPAKAGTDAFGVWVSDANPDLPGGLGSPLEQQVLDSQFDVYDSATRTAKIATTTRDLDNLGDGLAEILAMSNAPAPNTQDGVLLVVRPLRTPPNDGKLLPGLRVGTSAQLEAIDIDGDGFRDAVGFFGAPPDGKVVAFLNDGKGAFIIPGITLTIPPPGAGAQGGGKPVAFAGIALRGSSPVDPARKQTNGLAVLTDTSLVLATLRPDKQGFDVRSLSSLLGGRGVAGATGIAAGDFNGDGVEDIAIADGSIRLVLQQPARSAK